MSRSTLYGIIALPLITLLGACSNEGDHNLVVAPGGADVALTKPGCIHVDPANIDPGNFVDEIDNPFYPLTPGAEFVYRSETKGGVEVTNFFVTFEEKVILGVTTTVVHDRLFLDGSLIEDTTDWFAQDVDGNVWYFGEDTKELENGVVVSTAGSWEAGVDGAQPGIIMLACPRVGDEYRQEFYSGVAEDKARVSSLTKRVSVPFGSFRNCLKTLDFTPLDPDAREYKFYAPGIGLVLETVPGSDVREELISVRHLDDDGDLD